MTRANSESARTTLFQIEALASTLRHGSFASAAADLGVRDKHRLIRAVERLAENLQIDELSRRIGDELVVPGNDLVDLEVAASQLLRAVKAFEETADALKTRTILVRCSTYPSMVTSFLADAVHEFESVGCTCAEEDDRSRVRRAVRFVDLESTRRQKPNEVLTPLVDGFADVVVGPTVDLPDGLASEIEQRVLYAWELVAAVHPQHPLRGQARRFRGKHYVTVEMAAQYPLLLSPPNHASRKLLAPHEPARGFNVELETSNSQARVALGRDGLRVPLIADDSLVDAEFDPTWPVVTAGARTPIGASHSIYWRKDAPATVAHHVQEFVVMVDAAAERLRTRSGQ